ncbi:hypothetical protein [Oceanisphaera avium]|uniref:Secreted protein n=1 Tax=Oceanisphaera avium TaxID=1903694 RepID=A0A1Y0CUQ5_9GAMM|nr:hypothetical protein [Oceanisphaera avium]ART78979.1 hypothetical protein CBP12_01475 [Oceanisphaera avium]
MRLLTTGLVLSALLGLTACEPSGPAADIGDNIDQVADTQQNNASEPSAPAAVNDTNNEVQKNAPEPEVITEQKEQIDQANKEASVEAEERLNEILEETIDEP